jgi:hypothetical protein
MSGKQGQAREQLRLLAGLVLTNSPRDAEGGAEPSHGKSAQSSNDKDRANRIEEDVGDASNSHDDLRSVCRIGKADHDEPEHSEHDGPQPETAIWPFVGAALMTTPIRDPGRLV